MITELLEERNMNGGNNANAIQYLCNDNKWRFLNGIAREVGISSDCLRNRIKSLGYSNPGIFRPVPRRKTTRQSKTMSCLDVTELLKKFNKKMVRRGFLIKTDFLEISGYGVAFVEPDLGQEFKTKKKRNSKVTK